ncbi:hypothetical protein DYH09_21115 [bacterium CPR1]|nr:hypothetical protein [bacterium CPR1]
MLVTLGNLSPPPGRPRPETRQPAEEDLGQLSPCEVVQLSATREVDPKVLLDALGMLPLEVVNHVPSPILRATLEAARAARMRPETEPSVGQALEYRLRRWHDCHRLNLEGGTLQEALSSPRVGVVGKVITLPAPESAEPVDLDREEGVEVLTRTLDFASMGAAAPPPDKVFRQRDGQPVGREVQPPAISRGGRGPLRDPAELSAAAETRHPPHTGSSQVAVLRKLLSTFPERADAELLERELKPLVHGQEGSTEALELVLAHYGPGPALDLTLARPAHTEGLLDCLTEQVRHTGFKPGPEQLGKLGQLAVQESQRFEGHRSIFRPLCELLAAVEKRHPGSLELSVREEIQQGLLSHPQVLWPAYAGNSYPGVCQVAAGHPQLKDRLMQRLDHPAALALLTHADLDEREWARLKLEVSKGPRFDNDHTPGEFARAELRRRLGQLTPTEAVDRVDELAARTGVDPDKAHNLLLDRLLEAIPPGDKSDLAKVAGWTSHAVPLFPIFEEAVRQNRFEPTVREVEGSLERMSVGLVGGHEQLVAGLARLAQGRPMQEMERRYATVLDSLHDNHGSIGGTRNSLKILQALNHLPDHELASSLQGVARLKTLGWESSKPLEQIFQSIEGSAPGRGLELFDSILRHFEPKQFDLALGFYQAVRMSDTPIEPTMERFQRACQCTPRTTDALALLPALNRLDPAQKLDTGFEVLERIQKADSSDGFLPAAEIALQALEQGQTPDQAWRAALGNLLPAPGEAVSGIRLQGNRLQVGNTNLRVRSRP